MAARHGAAILLLEDQPDYVFEDFEDEIHLGERGAAKFTPALVDRL